tara:strand:- start:1880 stop:2194 length:315 start_codon:yes stop_codon:yes gene_type:complete
LLLAVSVASNCLLDRAHRPLLAVAVRAVVGEVVSPGTSPNSLSSLEPDSSVVLAWYRILDPDILLAKETSTMLVIVSSLVPDTTLRTNPLVDKEHTAINMQVSV